MNDAPHPGSAPARHTCIEVLVAIARFHGVDLSVPRLVHEHALTSEPRPDHLLKIARQASLVARKVRLTEGRLRSLGAAFPVLGVLSDGRAILIKGIDDKSQIVYLDPMSNDARERREPFATLAARWRGDAILLKRSRAGSGAQRRFGLGWFMPEIWRQRQAFRDVVIAALALNILALVIPIYFQIVIDKVLVHQTATTLQVLTVGVLLAIAFEATLSWLRSYVLMHAVRKIDIRMSTETFRHLLALPASFFNRNSAGVLAKHMQQTERIREFLTGQLLSTLLDLTVLVVFLPLLFMYSATLTFVVLGFTLAIVLVIAVLIVPFRRALDALYRAEGERQALLVETIHGSSTIKSLAIEPAQRRRWDDLSALAVERNFAVGRISLGARTLSHALEQAMGVAIIAIGVYLVFERRISVGELIAFQMLSNRVSQPLVRFVGLINQYQETLIAVRMLGNVMNAKAEQTSVTRSLRPAITGDIRFHGVRFGYPDTDRFAADGIDLHIRPGTTVGIVGPSGSGKTTLARLIQALYPVQSGAILVDGVDLREIDLDHLRSSIGVVPQEAFLFRGTIRENIARTRPDATTAEVVRAAQIAGAYDFIRELPGGRGLDFELEEGAVNLSGGQRQRLAIARALVRDPPILIFDEATSALDPESERIVQRNLAAIARGRTLVMISHRLSMVRHADMIIVMDRGKVADRGRHEELIERCAPYRTLWVGQTGEVS